GMTDVRHFPPKSAPDRAWASWNALKQALPSDPARFEAFSRRYRRHQPFHAENVERPTQIVGERRQAKLGAHFFEAAQRGMRRRGANEGPKLAQNVPSKTHRRAEADGLPQARPRPTDWGARLEKHRIIYKKHADGRTRMQKEAKAKD